MRLFAAVPLNDEVRAAVAAEQRRVLARVPALESAVRLVQLDQMHLTLVFIGEVADPQVPSLAAALAEPIPRSSFELIVAGLGMFPPRGTPRVLWIGVTAGGQEVGDLQQLVRSRVTAAGYAVDTKPFHPHLTLARFREGHSTHRRALADLSAAPAPVARLRVDEVVLFESRLPAGRGTSGVGPTYTAVAHAVLKCS
jgi:RNA 2',3'-cyclic 3'-phosphodiesterase